MAEPERENAESLARSLRVHDRDTPEFGRVLAFSDGIFAIAMTLLVVGITVPALQNGASVRELADSLNEMSEEIISFFISFAVIGRYWVAHHRFFALLGGADLGLLGLNLLYLAFVAFLPFPTALLGDYFENPLSVSIYAVTIALVSGCEVLVFRHAHKRGLLRVEMPPDVYRWGLIASGSPVVLFLISVPAAFVNSYFAVVFWFLNFPFQALLGRWQPPLAREYWG